MNRNTINAIYTQLRDEGLVIMQKGRGTTVADSTIVASFRSRQQALYDYAQAMITEAQLRSLPPDELLLAAFAYRQLFATRSQPSSRVLFVECREHDHIFYRKEVERITKKDVTITFLDDRDVILSAMREAEDIVTTLNHAEEVKALASLCDKSVITIGATIGTSALLEIARLDAKSTVGFVCLGKRGGEWMAQRVQEAGISQIHSLPVGVDHASDLRQLVQTADHLYASAAVYEQVQALAPDKTRLYPMVLEHSSQSLLQDVSGRLQK